RALRRLPSFPTRRSSDLATCRSADSLRRPQLPIPDDRPAPLPASVPTTPSSTRRSSRPWQITPADHAPPATDPVTPCRSPYRWSFPIHLYGLAHKITDRP